MGGEEWGANYVAGGLRPWPRADYGPEFLSGPQLTEIWPP